MQRVRKYAGVNVFLHFSNSSYQSSTPTGSAAPQGGYNGYTYSNNSYYPGPSMQDALPTDEDTTPISTLGYIGYLILFHIPVAGFIVAIIFAVGATKNVNVKNLARAILIIDIVVIGLYALIYGSMFAMILHEMH